MLVFAVFMWLLHKYMPFMQAIPFSARWLSLIFIVAGLTLDLTSLFLFLRAKTTAHPFHENRASTLVTTGFYQYTRNPMYLGLLLLLIGWAIRMGSATPFLLLPLFVMVITSKQIIGEEKALSEVFGEEYLTYKSRVRRWL